MYLVKYLLFGIAFLSLQTCQSQANNILDSSKQSTKVNQYAIVVDSLNPRVINVQADLNVGNDTLYMDWEAASFLKNGWAHFVKDLKAFDAANKPLTVTSLSSARWLLKDKPKNNRIHLKYSIEVKHDQINWEEGGHDEAAYALEDCLFFVGSAVFISGSKQSNPKYQVKFQLPSTWKIATSLKPLNATDFIAEDTEHLTKSCFLVGDILLQNVVAQGIQIQLASANNNEATIQLLQQITPPIIQQVVQYFGGIASDRFLCVANIAPQTTAFQPYFSGGAFPNALSLILPSPPDENLAPIIGYLFTHELTHLWNGVGFQASEPALESWFIEGFTDYITLQTLLKLGFIDAEFFLNNQQGIRDQYDKYQKQVGDISMREAGHSKQENYDLIYNGGFITAFITDIELSAASNGESNLQTFMQALYQKYAIDTPQEKYAYTDLINLLNQQSSADFEVLYNKVVLKTNKIELAKYLEKIGLAFNDEDMIIHSSDADALQEKLRVLILNQ